MNTPDLPLRFLVRAWRAAGLDSARAAQRAVDLELQFDGWGLHPAISVRAVRPAVFVDAADWQPAGM